MSQTSKKENIFIVDYACGFHKDLCEVDYVSKLRSLSAIRALKKYPDAYLVLGAGMSNVTCGCGDLSSMIDQFLTRHGIEEDRILRNNKGHNTKTETEAAYELILEKGIGKVVCATSSYHALRVWGIWVFRFGITPEMFVSHYSPSFEVSLREFLKIIPDWILAFTRRFKIVRDIWI